MFNCIFDEVKEVKYYKEITDFKNLKIWNTLKKYKTATGGVL